jgi:hypothetical protein
LYISNSNDNHFADDDSSGEESINDVVIEQQVFDRKSREIPVLFSSKDVSTSTEGSSFVNLVYRKILRIPVNYLLHYRNQQIATLNQWTQDFILLNFLNFWNT